MTSPGMPPATPPSGGGMPKWVIFLIVAILVIVLGCCGGWAACTWMCSHVARTAGGVLSKAQQQLEEQARRAQEEAQRRAATQGIPVPDNGGPGGAAGDAGGNQGAGNAGAGGNAGGGGNATGGGGTSAATPEKSLAAQFGAGKLPSNFPKDIPVMSGLSPTGLTGSDKLKGSGTVTLTGSANRDDVAAYYEKEMGNQGWKIESNQDVMNMTIMSFSKDNRKATVQIAPDTDKKGTLAIINYEGQPQ